MKKCILLSIFFSMILFPLLINGLDVPYLMGSINDYAQILSADAIKDLEKKLKGFEEETGSQIAVLTIKSLEGDDISQFGIKVADTWKIGQKDKDNGVILIIATEDHKLRIEVGYDQEDKLTDFKCKSIIMNEITPSFKENNYSEGITKGIDAIIGTIKGQGVSLPETTSKTTVTNNSKSDYNTIDAQLDSQPLLMRFLLGVFIFSILGLFTFFAIFVKGAQGIFLYFFMIPFWATFPMISLGTKMTMVILIAYLVGVPLLKIYFKISKKGQEFYNRISSNIVTRGNSYSIANNSSLSSRSSSSFSSSKSSFSGGGGRFGGGGASGSW